MLHRLEGLGSWGFCGLCIFRIYKLPDGPMMLCVARRRPLRGLGRASADFGQLGDIANFALSANHCERLFLGLARRMVQAYCSDSGLLWRFVSGFWGARSCESGSAAWKSRERAVRHRSRPAQQVRTLGSLGPGCREQILVGAWLRFPDPLPMTWTLSKVHNALSYEVCG